MKTLVAGVLLFLLALIATAQNPSQPPVNETAPTLSQKQEVITNQDVIAMLGAGLSAELVAAKIRSSKCQCNTSPAALAELKAASVPDNVLLAMVQSALPPGQKQVGVSDILQAKTVYLLNRATDFKVFDRLPEKLQKWGRWTIVQRPDDADLVLVFSVSQTYAGTINTGSVSATGTYASGVGTSIPVMSDQRFLIAVDRVSERQLKAVSCERRVGAGYTAGVLVNRMRKEIEKLDKQSSNKH